ncbi:uncharacterized protein K02A2.6-like [Branchiostoma floridae]|uniref:Uncharacterized protein K02A2.6-like n=1 Tax=Branchiostoma floridae TaxID=7739 RepID=A0A9J7LD57_BRAFL|nr:uncharacterized protein K02A2.6-like [Branchiostoma floridae]
MVSYGGKCPEIDWTSPALDEAWKRFKEHVELMFSGPLKDQDEEVKISYLKIWINPSGRDILNTFEYAEGDDKKKLKTYYDKFATYVKPKSNQVLARYRFHNRTQGPNEPVEQFIRALINLAKDCNFKDTNEMVLDRLVFGTNSNEVRKKLIGKGSELKLDEAIRVARTYESDQSTLKSIAQPVPSNDVHGVQAQHRTPYVPPRPFRKTRATGGGGRGKPRYTRPTNACGRCGKGHNTADKCPANGKECRKCGKKNHFAAVCRSKSVSEVRSPEEEFQDFHIEAVHKKKVEGDQAFVDLHIAGTSESLKCKLDTGAQVNVLPERDWIKLRSRNSSLEPTKTRLFGYGNTPLEVKGKCSLRCNYKGRSGTLDFFVVKANATPVLSLKACLSLKLIQLVLTVKRDSETAESIKQEYSDVFQGIGRLPSEYRIKVDPNVEPVVHAPRKFPVSLREPLKKELDRMESLGVIQKVDEPTEWVNSLVVVEKPKSGKLRICLDPRDLNKAIKREHYQLPTLEDISTRLAGSKYFAVVDARSGYWQICLDEESSKLTTFNTAFGQYCFTRLPFGVHSAQEVFQKKMDSIFGGLEGVEVIVDDVLVHASGTCYSEQENAT